MAIDLEKCHRGQASRLWKPESAAEFGGDASGDLLIDKTTPLDVLHANSAARLLAVNQLLESLSRLDMKAADNTDCNTWPAPSCCATAAICWM